jgi:tRNA (guanine-N7-)-methyltransferase
MANRILKDYENISLKPEELDGKIGFESIFGRSGPVHIEIGSGKGTFLVSQARALPEINFLGVEWASKYYRHAVDRFGRWEIGNVRIIRTDAAFFVDEHVADESVDCFHIYFPDPWPKTRHHRRRFVGKENMPNIIRALKTSGRINIATDHAGYFEQIENILEEQVQNEKIRYVDFKKAEGAKDSEAVGTNYERKYIVEGRNVYTIAAEKI